MRVRVAVSGGPLAARLRRSHPIDINVLTTGTTSPPGPEHGDHRRALRPGNGRTTIVNNTFSVPGAQELRHVAFIVNLDDQINGALGLPSAAGNNEAQFLVEFTPTRPHPGVIASFTTTPASGPAPLNVASTRSGSTGDGRSPTSGTSRTTAASTRPASPPAITYHTPGPQTVAAAGHR